MIWEHKVSLDWLKMRQNFLTASDVRKLVPLTATGRPRKVTDEDRIKVLAGKLRRLTDEDCVSTGAAARGHLLEPYAIEVYNKCMGKKMFHWDDVIVTSDKHSVAFSPDAMTTLPGVKTGLIRVDASTFGPCEMLEIKSYYPERHLLAGCTQKMDLEERWQIAAAMFVCDSIEAGSIAFFNPSMNDQMFIARYDRADLDYEITVVEQVSDDWDSFMRNKSGNMKILDTVVGSSGMEEIIVMELEERKKMNP